MTATRWRPAPNSAFPASFWTSPAWAPRHGEAVRTAELVGAALTAELSRLQASRGVDAEYRIETQRVVAPSHAEQRVSGKLRTLVGVFALGAILLFVVVSAAEAVTTVRAERRKQDVPKDKEGSFEGVGTTISRTRDLLRSLRTRDWLRGLRGRGHKDGQSSRRTRKSRSRARARTTRRRMSGKAATAERAARKPPMEDKEEVDLGCGKAAPAERAARCRQEKNKEESIRTRAEQLAGTSGNAGPAERAARKPSPRRRTRKCRSRARARTTPATTGPPQSGELSVRHDSNERLADLCR